MANDPRARHLASLFEMFPSGISDDQRIRYLGIVQKHGIDADVLEEAVERIIVSRKVSTCPKPAEILEQCRDVRSQKIQEADDEPCYTWSEARALAERRLRYINNIPGLRKRIAITPENIEIHVRQMARTGWRIEGE